MSGTEEEWEVETILGHELRGEKMFFLVKWKGFENIWNSWEPESNLENSPAMLNDYRRRAGLAITTGGAPAGRHDRRRRHRKAPANVSEVLGWKPGCSRESIVYVVRLMDNSLSQAQSSVIAKSHPEKLIDFYERLVDGIQMPPPPA
jgi:hypothetical protein